jgi:hypothetical protein
LIYKIRTAQTDTPYGSGSATTKVFGNGGDANNWIACDYKAVTTNTTLLGQKGVYKREWSNGLWTYGTTENKFLGHEYSLTEIAGELADLERILIYVYASTSVETFTFNLNKKSVEF